jgi:hypothetical protein
MYRFPSDIGFQAGLRVWIVFILLFWLLRFRAELAILLGAVAGLAVGYIVTYWNAQKLPDTPSKPVETPDNPLFRQVTSRLTQQFRRSPVKKPSFMKRKPPKRLGK